jgi:2-octaprenyl-6-methoxyphenol hydroxylase
MQYDVIIIGGGMVGASLACALSNTSLRIALIDATQQPAPNDSRLIALNDNSYRLFNKIGIWDSLAQHAAPIQQVHISEKGRFGMLRLKAEELELSALGYVVPAKEINIALNQKISGDQQKFIDIIQPATLTELMQDEDCATLKIQTASGLLSLETSLVIAADGTHSTTRNLLNIATETIDYQQSAIVTVTQLNRDHQNIAYERFHEQGVIAMLPLKEQQSATILTSDNETTAELLALSDADFLQLLQLQFGYRLGRLCSISKRHVYPLQLIRAHQTMKERVILIGNAAHTLHPVAAQGLNLALAEIAILAESIKKQADSLATSNWQDFIDWQQKQQKNSITLSHRLPQLFTSNFSVVNFARQIGMLGLDIFPPAKRRFAALAMGKFS